VAAVTLGFAIVAAVPRTATTAARPAGVARRTTTTQTIKWAEQPGQDPQYIFPLDPPEYADNFDNVDFSFLMYEPLYQNSYRSPTVNYADSIGDKPVWSDGDRVLTVTLKKYYWSNGTPVTARDLEFTYNLVKAVGPEWGQYIPGAFPDNMTSMKVDSPRKVTITLDHAYNPTYFDTSYFELLVPLPQNVWDRESIDGPVGNYDETVSGAKKVWNFLTSYSAKLGTYTDKNKIWGVTDGPYRLETYGGDSSPDILVPSRSYSGHRASAVLEEFPFTSTAAEYNELRSGALTVGYVPLSDYRTFPAVESQGYRVIPTPQWAVYYYSLNYKNPALGHAFAQLYMRQVLEHLMDQKTMVKYFLHGYGVPTYGVTPIVPKGNPYVTKLDTEDLYSYNLSKAQQLLKIHGWRNVSGIATCEDPTKCGPGVKRGTKLSIKILNYSGSTSLTQESELYQSDARKAGIHLILQYRSLNSINATTLVPCTARMSSTNPACAWQMSNFDGFDFNVYPTAGDVYAAGGIYDAGGYSNQLVTAAVHAVRYAPTLGPFFKFENLVTEQIPTIWLPTPDILTVVAKNLRGPDLGAEFDDVAFNYWSFSR